MVDMDSVVFIGLLCLPAACKGFVEARKASQTKFSVVAVYASSSPVVLDLVHKLFSFFRLQPQFVD